MKPYELASRKPNIPLNRTAGRFYFEKFVNNFYDEQECFKLLFRSNINDDEKKKIFKKFICIINFETNAYCNRICHYCPLSIFDRKNQISRNTSIDDDLFFKILYELESIKYSSTICLNLYNEPLSDAKILMRIKNIKAKLPESFLRFNSNGDFLDNAMLKQLESNGLDSINITLHTTKINDYNDKNAKEKIDRFYSKLNITQPEYQIMPNQCIQSNLQFGNLNIIVNTSNWDLYGNDRGGVLDNLSIKNRTQSCVKIFREFSIDHQGRVFPCCNIFPDDPKNTKHIFGNLRNENIFDIFSSQIWVKWRESLFTTSLKKPPCSTCSDMLFENDNLNDKKIQILNQIKRME